MDSFENVQKHIRSSWEKSVKKRDQRPDFVLPYDFIPPCIDGDLTDLYYWDTYFTNKGLYVDGLEKYALFNIENLKFCLNLFGCVPNMCRTNGADYASQPPLLVYMIDDYYEYSKDEVFLEGGFSHLEKEYLFWETKRKLPNGLNRYGTNQTNPAMLSKFMKEYFVRCNLNPDSLSARELKCLSENKIAEGESGEDHTPRFKNKAAEIAPVDLNSYLYGFERLMEKFSVILRNGKESIWSGLAEKRLELIEKYCYDENSGVFFDYNATDKQKTFVYCAACYVPFAIGVSAESKGVRAINEKLVLAHGVCSCEKMQTNGAIFQWGYPNMWAPHNYWANVANQKTGLFKEANEIRNKYLNTVSNVFEKTGKLYEKYDAQTGDKAVFNEYGLPEMLGWTAGVFQVFYKDYAESH